MKEDYAEIADYELIKAILYTVLGISSVTLHGLVCRTVWNVLLVPSFPTVSLPTLTLLQSYVIVGVVSVFFHTFDSHIRGYKEYKRLTIKEIICSFLSIATIYGLISALALVLSKLM